MPIFSGFPVQSIFSGILIILGGLPTKYTGDLFRSGKLFFGA